MSLYIESDLSSQVVMEPLPEGDFFKNKGSPLYIGKRVSLTLYREEGEFPLRLKGVHAKVMDFFFLALIKNSVYDFMAR